MANKHLRRSSHKVRGTKEVWWYEEPEGIIVVHEIRVLGVLHRTDEIKIPWPYLQSALARKDR